MFARRHDASASVMEFTFEGRKMSARHGDSLAAALLCNGVQSFRETALSGAERGPFCLMGVCFECLVEVNGEPNKQACLTTVEPGMDVRMQRRGVTVPTI